MAASDDDHETKSQTSILVVEDDPMVQDVLVESIRATGGFHVDVCGDGETALDKNALKPYDLILTDMKLPGLDGLHIIKNLRSGDTDTDVIVLTGFGSIENAVECMKAGALDYLIKPFTVEQIQMAVRRAMEVRDLKRKAIEREFYKQLSYVDALTGVYNRRYLNQAIEAEIQKSIRHGTSFVLLMIDIDYFKIYNDLNGHQIGDDALAKMAHLFRSVCRAYDIVARYGGEEFAVIFPGAHRGNAVELANRLLNEVRLTVFEGEEGLPNGSLTVSIGAGCFPDHANTSEDLIRCADQALYAAKNSGKNTVILFGDVAGSPA